MNKIRFLDHNGNSINYENKEQAKTFREIAPNIPKDHPFEDLIILDMTENKIVSKFMKLNSNRQYKLLVSHQIYKQLTEQTQQFLTLSQQYAGEKEELKSTKENLEKLRFQLQQTKSNLKEQGDTINTLVQKIAEQTKQIKELSEQCNDHQVIKFHLSELQNSYKTLQHQYNLLVDQDKISQNQLRDSKQEQDQLVANINNLQQKIQKQNQKKEKQEKQLQDYEKKIEQLRIEYEKKLEEQREVAYNRQNKIIQEKDAKYDKLLEETIPRLLTQQSDSKFVSQAITSKPIQIDQYKEKQVLQDQITNLQNKIFVHQNQEEQLKQQIRDLEQKLKQTKDQLKQQILDKEVQYQNNLKTLNDQLSKYQTKAEELQRQVTSQDLVKKEYLQSINDMDMTILKQSEKIKEFESSKKETIFRTRLMRLIETSQKPHISVINFGIEQVFHLMQQGQLENTQWEEDTFKIFDIQTAQTHNGLSKIDRFFQKIYEPNDLDFQAEAIVSEIKKVKGRMQTRNISQTEDSYDEIKIFQCLEKVKNVEKDQKFALKIIKSYKEEERESSEAAKNECMGLLIAQNMLESFYSELGQGSGAPTGFKFQQPYIISQMESFKVYIQKKMGNKQNQFKILLDFIKELNQEESDSFYNSIRLAQISKDVEYGSLKMLQQCINQSCQDNRKEYIQIKLLTISQQVNFQKQLKEFLIFLDDIYIAQFPLTKYYAAYKIHNSKNVPFIKYNGGLLHFDNSNQGKFFSAFSYYTIIKSHGQVCVSHIQGVGQELYDPLVSTYDGFLNKLDQGINEIRLIESKYCTAKPEDICEMYLNRVGIARNQKQKQQQI